MNRANTLTWLALLALTALTFGLGRQDGPAAVRWLLALAGVKCLLVAGQFMELRHAAWGWPAGVGLLLLLLLGLAAALA